MADTCPLCQEPEPHTCDRVDAAPNEFVHHGLKRLTQSIETANLLKAVELGLLPQIAISTEMLASTMKKVKQ